MPLLKNGKLKFCEKKILPIMIKQVERFCLELCKHNFGGVLYLLLLSILKNFIYIIDIFLILAQLNHKIKTFTEVVFRVQVFNNTEILKGLICSLPSSLFTHMKFCCCFCCWHSKSIRHKELKTFILIFHFLKIAFKWRQTSQTKINQKKLYKKNPDKGD